MALRDRTVSPGQYRRVVAIAGVFLALIIFTGAAVRLTQSGLGCEDWPTCSDNEIVPEWSFHGWIEFGNRLVSGVVGIAVMAAVLAAYARKPYRKDLVPWAWLMVVGVVAQILLGGVTVLTGLHPLVVGAHFGLSIILMWNVIVLWTKAGGGAGRARPTVDRRSIQISRGTVLASVAVLTTGVLVTGTGPHSGDNGAARLSLDLESIVRIHSIMAWIVVALLVALAVSLGPTTGVKRLLAIAVTQGGIGYLQYFTGVPALLVELHVIGAVAVFSAALLHHLSLFERPEVSSDVEPEVGLDVLTSTESAN